MENFPFPFYVVLKEINSLPTIITEALKQWFEMVSKIDSK
jgi:midasin